MLKAFMVYEKDLADVGCELVFANTAQEAKRIGFGGDCLCDTRWHDARVKRLPAADEYADNGLPRIVESTAIMRALGWQCEDGGTCGNCGLNDFDEAEFKVCDLCDRCPDCGHSADCPKREHHSAAA